MKNIVLRLLTPNWLLYMILLMISYKLVMIINGFLSTYERNDVTTSLVTEQKVKNASNKKKDEFLFDLFGTVSSSKYNTGQDVPSSLQKVPLSSLELNISGIVASSTAKNSLVIISKDNQQFSRGIDEQLPGYDATIVDIFNDHIVVSYKGKNESFFLDYDKKIKNTISSKKKSDVHVDTHTHKDQTQNLTDFVNIFPETVNGKLNGYRLKPGKDSQFFAHIGLQDNDLAVSLNGLDLRDRSQAQQIMEQLPDLTEVKITVERDGQLHDVFIAVGED